MIGYTKLFSDIVMSTIWREPDTVRILWITMLALKDRWHIVNASLPGLADAARLSIEDTQAGLNALSSPDPHSRSEEYEGRRIEKTDAGWLILNGEKYRNKMNQDERREYQRLKQREYRSKNKTSTSCLQKRQQFTHTDTDTDPKPICPTDPKSDRSMSGSTSEPRRSAATDRKEQQEVARRVLDFLNEKTGRNYRATAVNLDKITARLREDYTETQCRQVIVKKCREWMPDEKMAPYLRPATLFGREKFNQYAGELGQREVSHDFG